MSKVKTVAIVGSHPKTRMNAPWGDKSIDLWVFNSAPTAEWCKRATAVFEVHPAGEYTNPLVTKSEYWSWLQGQHVTDVIMAQKDPRVPMAKAYPLDLIIKTYLSGFRRGKEVNKYFTSTPCYAIAYALYMGYKRIELYGIEMETNSEYIYQRDGVGLWIGIALGLGVTVVLDQYTSMFLSQLYGFDDDHSHITREDLEENAIEIQKAFDAAQNHLNFIKGQMNAVISKIDAMRQAGAAPAEIQALGTEYGRLNDQHEQAIADVADLNGQLKMLRFYLAKIERQMMANGEAASVMVLRETKLRAVGLAV